jgi:hypothetical protein
MNEALRTPLAAMRVDPSTTAAHNVPLCPKCHAVLNFCRSITPDIDSSGFESYRLDVRNAELRFPGLLIPMML